MAIVALRFQRNAAALQKLCLEPHQDGGRQESLAALGQILLESSTLGQGTRGFSDPLMQPIQETINDSDHVDVPGIELASDSGILQHSNRHAGARFGHSHPFARGMLPT
jgi:hypothetical protein